MRGVAFDCPAAALLSLALCAPAMGAEPDPAPSPDPTFTLGVIEVIGQHPADSAALAVETVDAETLSVLHRDDLSEALDLLPGVTLQNVGQRRERLVSVRGFSSRQVPLFIDGVPVYVPYDGNVDLSRFGVDYVSEIKVSKGFASVLYGPNILGGAINVGSRKPTASLETGFEIGSEIGESSNSLEQRYSASVGGLRGQWYGLLTGSYVDSEGYALPDDFDAVAAENGGARENADSQDQVFSAKVGFLPDNGDEYALSYYRQDGEKNSPPYAGSAAGVQARFWEWPYWDKQSVYLTARNGVGSQGTLRWRAYWDQFRNALNGWNNAARTASLFLGSEYDDYTIGGNADFEWRWQLAQASRVALHWKQDVHREIDNTGAPEERYEDRSWALALEHEWRTNDTVTLTPGYAYTVQDGREAENNQNGVVVAQPVDRADAHNAQLAMNWAVTPDLDLLAGISRKTRFPTIKDRFSFRLGSAVPNPGLQPERAVHLEIGMVRRLPGLDLRFAVFQADLDDAIENVTIPNDQCTTPNPTCFQQQNIGEQRNRGVELGAVWKPLTTLKVDAQVSVLDRENRSRPELRQIDTPEQKYRLALAWRPVQRWTLKTDAQHETKRYSTTDGVRVADDFTLVHAFVRFEPIQHLGLELGGRNLFDELYAYQEGFFEPGRTWLAQLDYRY
ncbi:MAG: TonB-dependent receptor plug domain-containing protein [Panacagrimonas sp.]